MSMRGNKMGSSCGTWSQGTPTGFDSRLQVVYQKTESLKPNANNARTHSKQQIRQIADSIKAFGFTNPVLLDDTNTIIAGHGRASAAKLLGIPEIPTIRRGDLSPDQVRAYVIADNKLAANAGWDKSILAIELQHLLNIETEFDITVTGFEIPENDLVLSPGDDTQDADDPFEFEENTESITQPGDLWKLGKHRIFCGNATEETSYSTLMDTKRAGVVFIDPPYNVHIDGNVSGNGAIHHREFPMAAGEMSEAEFRSFLTASLKLLASHSTSGSVHFVCMDWRHAGELIAAGKQVYDSLLNVCVWVKNNGGLGSFYRSQHELGVCVPEWQEKAPQQRSTGAIRPQPDQRLGISLDQLRFKKCRGRQSSCAASHREAGAVGSGCAP